jgi:hypothetical protein
MNKLIPITIAACMTLVFLPAFGQAKEADHAAHHSADKPVATAPTQSSANSEKTPAMMELMQNNMKEMQALMTQIQGSHDPAERHALMQKHQQTMHAQMKAMQGMGGGMMMGMMNKSAEKGGDSKDAMKSGMPCGDMRKCHEMMEGRMDMMQMMMEQMMQHDAAEQAVITPGK